MRPFQKGWASSFPVPLCGGRAVGVTVTVKDGRGATAARPVAPVDWPWTGSLQTSFLDRDFYPVKATVICVTRSQPQS